MVKRLLTSAMLVLALLAMLMPLLLMLSGSLMTAMELEPYLTDNKALIPPVPQLVSLGQYKAMLIESPLFLSGFWRTLLVAVLTVLGQTAIAILNAYVFAKVPFRGREKVFLVLLLAMLMPFQVTVLPTYLMVRRLGLYDTQAALIVPLLFAPVWTFLLRQAMKQIPEVYLEAVRLESNRLTDVLCHAILPACRTGILTVVVLSFAEVWNMVEQPLIYLTDPSSYPLSLSLALVTKNNLNHLFAACVVFVFPALILWRMFSDEVLVEIGQLKVRDY